MKQARRPSELELQVLSLLWRRGPMNVRQVMAAMPDKRPRAYTTILSVMQVMEKKGFLKHTSEGNVHVYRPAVVKGKVLGSVLRRLVEQVFAGSPAAAMQQLLEETPLTEGELTEMRSLLNTHATRSHPEHETQPRTKPQER